MSGGLQALPLQLGQIRQLRDGMQVRGGEYIVDVRPVVLAVRQQGVVRAGQGFVRQRSRQQVLPVALVSAAVVRQVDDEVRAVPGGVVEVPDSLGLFW